MDSEKEIVDRRPGAVPEIRADGDSVIFVSRYVRTMRDC